MGESAVGTTKRAVVHDEHDAFLEKGGDELTHLIRRGLFGAGIPPLANYCDISNF